MSDEMAWRFLMLMSGLLIGSMIGSVLQAFCWASKADGPSRMLFRGKFYRVEREPPQNSDRSE